MGEPKSFASLSSGLLARKGAARPAMRPQGFGQAGAGLDDLGWNDMGYEAPRPAAAPVARDEAHDAFGSEIQQPLRNPLSALTPASPVHQQQVELKDRLSAYVPDDSVEDEIDETAELYEPEAETAAPVAPAPVAVSAPTPVAPAPVAVAPVAVAPAPVAAAPVAVAPVAPVAAPAAPRRAPRPRAAPGSSGKAAFTLRLDGERHLKLRLACAVSGRSAQMLVTDALDRMLAEMPEIAGLADQAPRAKRAAG